MRFEMTNQAKTLDRNLYVVQLTSLRGIACMVVLVGHAVQVVQYHNPSAGWAANFLRELITGTVNAEAAVVLFFVLSGCVLSLSLRNVTTFNLPIFAGYFVKRVFRLYPVLWLSLLIAPISMVISANLAKQGIFADWLDRNILSGLSLRHSLLSISGMYTQYNGPMWTLRVELIASVLFPIIFLLMRNKRYRAVTLAVLTIVALLPVDHRFGTCWALSFAAGALIPMLPYHARSWNIPLVWLALVAFVYDRFALGGLNVPPRIFDLIETAAAFVIIRDIFAAGERYQFLLAPKLIMLGEISFSIYLLHLPVFLIVFDGISHFTGVQPLLDHPALTQLSLSVLTASVTIPVSMLTYRWVELPVHNFGRSLAKRISARGKSERPALAGAGLQNLEPPLA